MRRELIGDAIRTHGLRRSSEYSIWCSIKQRCLNHNNIAYADYGARGITVCPEWADSFECFLRDVGFRPSKRHTIDRIDNDGNYQPDNCRWATREKQNNNRRDNKLITFNGRTQTLSEWARQTGVKVASLSYRVRKGWPLADALAGTHQRCKATIVRIDKWTKQPYASGPCGMSTRSATGYCRWHEPRD